MASLPTDSNDADAQAAGWATRLSTGPLTAPEDRALSAWLSADPQNPSRLDGCRRLYARLEATIPALVDSGRLPDYLPSEPARPTLHYLRPLGALFATVAVLALAVVWWIYRPQTLSTSSAHRDSVTLADGSRVDLNAQTTLEVRLQGGERRVRLTSGEAFFSVAKDHGKPFFVETSAGTIRVTGTAFDVRVPDTSSVAVTVIEGSVAVSPANGRPPQDLHPSDQLALADSSLVRQHLAPSAAQDAVAWREGRIVFVSERLDTAVERFADYHGRPIEVASAVGNLRIGGRFKLDELDAFLHDLTLALPVKIEHTPDGTLRIVRR
jgi:transmembrane sensor